MTKKIITVTPNPALDISGVVDRIKANEKAYVHDEKRRPGGNAINAARILHDLDIPVLASGFLGGSVGDEVGRLLDLEGLKHHFIKIKGATRVNVTISNKKDSQQTRLSFAGPKIEPSEVKALLKLLQRHRENDMLIIGGSLPPQFSVRNLNQLIAAAGKRKIPVVVDCPGKILKSLRSAELLLIKPNLEEFQALTKSRVSSLAAVKRKAEKLLENVSLVCVSSVEGGALLVSRSGCYFGRIPPVKIKSTVGAGDSMVGSMCAQIYRGNTSVEDILRWGLAAAAATLNESGTKQGRASRIVSLYKKTVVRRVA